ncbi:MAG: uracil-DNA glycosylase [bacterium]
MEDDKSSLDGLIRRALQAQIDLGLDEVIIDRQWRPAPAGSPVAKAGDQISPHADLFCESTAAVMAAEYGSLDDHRQAICNCQKCMLGKTRNKFVYGVGNPSADIMFVGEAPGADEDRQGEPFVGRAGQLLDKILAAMALDRSQVYIANILKCRPPGNRDPQPDEMELCFPYLREQVALIRPKIICGLGRIAGQALLQTKTPLGKLRKLWHEYEGVPLIVTYHPAALLRFPAYKRDTWEDMQMLLARYKEMIG